MSIDLDAIRAHIPKWGGGDLIALVAEVERLRAIVADQQMMLDEHQMDSQHAYEEGGHAERAAVVAWLRRGADEMACYAGCIERGEHRREEEP